ncbi:succinylglutamate desuccinylase [Shewanella sp. NFH-SH190041]|uniref:succinylglutamate desuccinylase n=1 Tax=Shewanella sp. NFH-SH190041 TaxID=2950245 RepID=UPI0021C418D4|nr:succinylglutamate desuccinylase [Shewanella sp. NFH-SH190041]BDM64154.1 succinylglutamate desuccinylase [Shewanella sp. NFH-SH190041]
MLKTLMASKDFLALTLACPDGFEQPESMILAGHTRISIEATGILRIEPLAEDNGKDIILSSGVHGNETAPIELCNSLIRRILNEDIRVKHRVLFLFGNPPAIFNGTRIVDENLNRLFSGEHSQAPGLINPERHRAKLLEQHVEAFYLSAPGGDATDSPIARQRLHYDLHTAIRGATYDKFAIYPFRHGRPYRRDQLCFLHSAGVNCVLFHHEPTTTFSYFSANEFGADAFTIELGKVFPMGQNDMSRFAAMDRQLTRLITDDALHLPEYDPSQFHLFRVSRSVVKQHDEFSFTFANDVKNFTAFARGSVLGYDGENPIVVEAEQEAIVFPNAKVPIGQRTLLCLVPEPAPEVM